MAVDRDPRTPARQRRVLRQLVARKMVHSQVSNETPTGSIDGVNDTFTLAHTPQAGQVQVSLNGLVMQAGTDYTLSGRTLVFDAQQLPQSGDNLIVSYSRA